MIEFEAIVVQASDEGYTMSIETRSVDDLPDDAVTIDVSFSCVNYKDALSASGKPGLTKSYPHTPGIDAAGVVVSSSDPSFAPGDSVTVTDYDLGVNTPGGWGGMIRVPAAWVALLPDGLTAEESMALGTAGLTAAQSVREVMAVAAPDEGGILVTGATGGVGSFAVELLGRLGYRVTAATGKAGSADGLKALGASEVIGRRELEAVGDRALAGSRWTGVVDTVGGPILSGAIASTCPRGIVTCCGNVASHTLNTTVFPFILRGVRLVGVDVGNCPMVQRLELWDLLAGAWKPPSLSSMVEVIGVEKVAGRVGAMLKGESEGRAVVAHG